MDPEFEKSISISFGELQHFNHDDITLCLTKEDAMQICRQSNASTKEVLQLWLNKKLLTAFASTSSDWQILLGFLQEYIKPMISSLSITKDCFTDYASFLNDLIEFTKSLKSILQNGIEPIGCILLKFLLKMVLDFLQFYEKVENNSSAIVELIKQANVLHSLVLQTITYIMDLHKDSIESQQLTQLLPELCEIGTCQQPLSMKQIIKNWNIMANICVLNLKSFPKDQTPPTWLTPSLQYLINEVAENINMLLSEETIADPIDKIEKLMRLTNFYIKLTENIFEIDIIFIDEIVGNMLMETLASTYCIPEPIMRTNIPSMLQKYVRSALFNVLKLMHDCSLIVHKFFSSIKKISNLKFFIDYLRLTIKQGTMKLGTIYQTFRQLCVNIMKDVLLFTNAKEYAEFLETYAALHSLSGKSLLDKDLKLGVLSDNIVYAHACTDVLLISARISISSPLFGILSKREFEYWQQINNCFPLFSNSHKQRNVQRLLQHYFNVCCTKGILQSNKELGEEIDMKKFSTLKCVIATHKPYYAHNLFQRLCNYRIFMLTPDAYYEMLALIEILATYPSSTINELPLGDLNILLIQMVECRSVFAFKKFIEAYFKCLDKTNATTQQHILSTLASHTSTLAKLDSWHVQKLIQINDSNYSSTLPNLKKNSTKTGTLMQKFLHTRTHKTQIFLESQDFPVTCFIRQRNHICAEVPTLKRPRLAESQERLITDVIQKLEKYLKHSIQLNVEGNDTLNNALQDIKNILSKI